MATKIAFKPVGGYVLVKPEAKEETTPSGIVISASAQEEKPQVGSIVALGTGKLDKDGKALPWHIAVGDKVFFRKYSPDEIEVDEETYLLMKEEDILGVFAK